jgi:hypothetical protein
VSASTCPRCAAAKRSSMFACRTCWLDLPRTVRDRIWQAYRLTGPLSERWCQAAADAFEAWGMDRPRWLVAAMEPEVDAG